MFSSLSRFNQAFTLCNTRNSISLIKAKASWIIKKTIAQVLWSLSAPNEKLVLQMVGVMPLDCVTLEDNKSWSKQ